MAIRLTSSSSQYVTLSANLPRSNFTAMVWYYPITLTGWRNIFYFQSDNGVSPITAIQSNAGVINTANIAGTTTLSVNSWYHMALVNDVTATNHRAYYNGNLEATDATGYIDSGAWLYYDMGVWTRNADYGDARYACIKIYSAVLTADEIKQEMLTIRPQRLANLVEWHPTFAGDTRTADWSGNGNSSTEINSPTSEDNPPVSWGSSPIIFPTAGGTVTFDQEGYRFRNDDGSETTATWMGSQDTSQTINKQSPFRLRVLVNTTTALSSAPYKLQYRKKISSSPDVWGDWRDVT